MDTEGVARRRVGTPVGIARLASTEPLLVPHREDHSTDGRHGEVLARALMMT